MLIYQFNLSSFGVPEQLISPRLAAIGYLVYGLYLLLTQKLRKKILGSPLTLYEWKKYVLIMILLLAYGLFLNLTIGIVEGYSFFVTMANICLLTIPVTWILVRVFTNIDDFMVVLVLVGLVQSCFIIGCLIDKNVALFLDALLNDTYSPHLRSGYAGGVACIGAPGVIRYAISILAISYLYVKYKKTYLLIIFTLFAVLVTMIARTGLLVDIICILFFIVCSNNVRGVLKFFIPALFIAIILYSLVDSGYFSDFLSTRYARMKMLKETGLNEGFFAGYFSGSFIPINIETLIGVGVVSGYSGNGYWINIDGGFLRIFSAVGPVLSICIYVYFFKTILKISHFFINKIDKKYILLLCAYFALADFKEITFFLVYPMCIFFSFVILIEREQNLEQDNHVNIRKNVPLLNINDPKVD